MERGVSALRLKGAISSGSKKGQVKMSAAAGFYFLFKVQVGPALGWFCCGCSIGSFYAFLLLQRARIFGSASLTYARLLAYVYVFGLPSRERERAGGERAPISSCLRVFLFLA